MAYRSSAIASSSTGGNLTATPAGTQANDYLHAIYSQDNLGQTVTPPSGWSEQLNLDHAFGSPDGQMIRYYDKVAAGGDGFTWTTTEAAENELICGALSGRATVSPTSFITGTTNTSNNASPITAAATGGTAAANDDLIALYATDGTGASWTFSAASGPGSFTERQDGGISLGFVSLHTLDNYGGGATGNVSSTITSVGNSAGWSAAIVAVKVDSGPAAPIVIAPTLLI